MDKSRFYEFEIKIDMLLINQHMLSALKLYVDHLHIQASYLARDNLKKHICTLKELSYKLMKYKKVHQHGMKGLGYKICIYNYI